MQRLVGSSRRLSSRHVDPISVKGMKVTRVGVAQGKPRALLHERLHVDCHVDVSPAKQQRVPDIDEAVSTQQRAKAGAVELRPSSAVDPCTFKNMKCFDVLRDSAGRSTSPSVPRIRLTVGVHERWLGEETRWELLRVHTGAAPRSTLCGASPKPNSAAILCRTLRRSEALQSRHVRRRETAEGPSRDANARRRPSQHEARPSRLLAGVIDLRVDGRKRIRARACRQKKNSRSRLRTPFSKLPQRSRFFAARARMPPTITPTWRHCHECVNSNASLVGCQVWTPRKLISQRTVNCRDDHLLRSSAWYFGPTQTRTCVARSSGRERGTRPRFPGSRSLAAPPTVTFSWCAATASTAQRARALVAEAQGWIDGNQRTWQVIEHRGFLFWKRPGWSGSSILRAR